MTSKQRVKVFIDGSNFYHYCKNIGIPSYPRFDFEKFIQSLVGNRKLVGKSYYIGEIKAKGQTKKAKKMMAEQMKLFSYLKKNKWKINKGYLLKSSGRYHEKGVDVKLALDIALGAVDNIYDTAILISSDTDILPAVEQAYLRKKSIEYVGFSNMPSRAMVVKCRKARLLKKKDLQKFIK